jgi:hypothetical protein
VVSTRGDGLGVKKNQSAGAPLGHIYVVPVSLVFSLFAAPPYHGLVRAIRYVFRVCLGIEMQMRSADDQLL